ncbi:hypothetical protein ACMV5I_15205 [Serratia sp. T13T92]|uniref:hypothetical protein n=1 Tax=Serratia sp. T13T92 TaxID=3397496 RepID=UPI0039DF6839
MRVLGYTEIREVSGAAWWSPSNILDFINGLTHTPNNPGTGSLPSEGPSSSHIGNAIGVGIFAVASLVAVATLISAASVGLAGIFGVATVAKNLK